MGEETVSHIIGVRTVGVPVTDQDRAVEGLTWTSCCAGKVPVHVHPTQPGWQRARDRSVSGPAACAAPTQAGASPDSSSPDNQCIVEGRR
jgi:hypothetical protein